MLVCVSEPDRIAAWRWMLLAHAAALHAIDAELSQSGHVSLAWYDVLLELNAAPGRRLRMSELGDRVVLSRTRVSRIVDDMVGAGLVQRIANPEDGRSSLAQLTDQGRAELRRAAPAYRSGIEKHFLGLLSSSEQRVLAAALQRVAEHHRDRRPTRR
jgi:DNA-binding MarR family transcriptional regulator